MESFSFELALPHKFTVLRFQWKVEKDYLWLYVPAGSCISTILNAPWDILFRNTHQKFCHFKQINKSWLWVYCLPQGRVCLGGLSVPVLWCIKSCHPFDIEQSILWLSLKLDGQVGAPPPFLVIAFIPLLPYSVIYKHLLDYSMLNNESCHKLCTEDPTFYERALQYTIPLFRWHPLSAPGPWGSSLRWAGLWAIPSTSRWGGLPNWLAPREGMNKWFAPMMLNPLPRVFFFHTHVFAVRGTLIPARWVAWSWHGLVNCLVSFVRLESSCWPCTGLVSTFHNGQCIPSQHTYSS